MKKTKRIAPRLSNGESRVGCGHGLPEHIKQALQMIAYERGESLSWVLEKKLIQSFQLEQPEYVPSQRVLIPRPQQRRVVIPMKRRA